MKDSEYLFVVYEEQDYEYVDNIFLELFKKGVAVKADKDCAPNELVSVVQNANAVMLVLSPCSAASSKLTYFTQMAEQMNKHIIPYFLVAPENLQLPPAFYTKIDGSATIPAYEYAYEAALMERILFEVKPYFAESLSGKKQKHSFAPLVAIFSIVVVLSVGAVYFLTRPPKEIDHKAMLEHVRNSTVQIYALTEGSDEYSTGSGFFINNKGLIATNNHVICDGEYYIIEPTNCGDDYYNAELILADPENDLAILKIEDYKVKEYLTFAHDDIRVGDNIFVSGYPKGIDLTISNGIISNKKHIAEGLEYFLITAAVSPGNSGGPVINENGEVIGIATAKYESAENLNLARPISYLEDLIKSAK